MAKKHNIMECTDGTKIEFFEQPIFEDENLNLIGFDVVIKVITNLGKVYGLGFNQKRYEEFSKIVNQFREIHDTYKCPFFCYDSWKRIGNHISASSGFWFRIFGYGLHFTNRNPSFSERNGFNFMLKLPFGWRMKFLKPRNK